MKNKNAKTHEIKGKAVKKEKSETSKRLDELREAMKNMSVRHATVDNITRFLLDSIIEKYQMTDKSTGVVSPFDDKAFLSDLATAIRGYEKVVTKEVVIPKLDWV